MQAVLSVGCFYILKCVEYFVGLKGGFLLRVFCVHMRYFWASLAPFHTYQFPFPTEESQPKQYLPVLVIVLILLDEGSGVTDLQSELQSSKAVLRC